MTEAAEPIRDKNGLTEEEFLAQYRPKDYPQPSLTSDICVFRRHPQGKLQLLLVQRGGHPCLGMWATPGGFCNPNETADACAKRELAEETHVGGLKLEPIGLYSTPGRDPRGWTISYAFVAFDDIGVTAQADDDAARAQWFDVDAVVRDDAVMLELTRPEDEETVLSSGFHIARRPLSARPYATDVHGRGLAFDHAQIVADAWLVIRQAL